MKAQAYKILLLESSEKTESTLMQILNDRGYQTETFNEIEPAIESIVNKSVDLVISDNNVKGNSGFSVFKLLLESLRNNGIPFFLVLETYVMEYILFGLEIGIDNFIVYPVSKDSVYSKIENQLRKKEQLNVFESGNFIEYFHSSSVAMFFVSNDKIYLVNGAFNRLFNGGGNKFMELKFDKVFNFANSKQNEFAYRRFQYDISGHCKLLQVQCFNNSNISYDISLYHGDNNGIGHVFAEIIPSVFTDFLKTYNGEVVPAVENGMEVNEALQKSPFSGGPRLTVRQQEVYELSACGMPIKLIAAKLNLSERTVEKHRENIMLKTKAKNIIEAIVQIQNNPNYLLILPKQE